MPSPTLVLGEALIDVVHTGDGTVIEYPGGSPANVALGLARLGHPVDFATRIGADERGLVIARHLGDEGVTLTEGSVADGPTSLAEATLDTEGAASYHFAITWDVPAGLSTDGVSHLHTGSIAATLEPGAGAVLETVRSARAAATISYDPNARPTLMGDPASVRERVEELVALSDVVKASDEDIAWLYAGSAVPEVLRRWGTLGAPLTVVTRGAQGAVFALNTPGQLTTVEAEPVEVVDTVGAGDSFMAGLLSGLLDLGLLGGVEARERLRAASLASVRPAIDRALACAAVTVSRAGANPPRRGELPQS